MRPRKFVGWVDKSQKYRGQINEVELAMQAGKSFQKGKRKIKNKKET